MNDFTDMTWSDLYDILADEEYDRHPLSPRPLQEKLERLAVLQEAIRKTPVSRFHEENLLTSGHAPKRDHHPDIVEDVVFDDDSGAQAVWKSPRTS